MMSPADQRRDTNSGGVEIQVGFNELTNVISIRLRSEVEDVIVTLPPDTAARFSNALWVALKQLKRVGQRGCDG